LSVSVGYRRLVAKGRQVRKALERAGWTRIRQSGSHEFFYDDEAGKWGFVVETPSVVGGGDATLEAAIQHAAEAIAFALEGDPRRAGPDGGRIEYLPIAVG
jgi:predicted RNA binding protein YcfA (HicA-like mRNA interferase family)